MNETHLDLMSRTDILLFHHHIIPGQPKVPFDSCFTDDSFKHWDEPFTKPCCSLHFSICVIMEICNVNNNNNALQPIAHSNKINNWNYSENLSSDLTHPAITMPYNI